MERALRLWVFGDLLVFVFLGLAPVVVLYRLISGEVTSQAWWTAVSVGLVATAILVVRELRDIDRDRVAGKITPAVILGRTATKIWYSVLLVAAYVLPILGWAFGVLPLGALLPLLTTPLAIRLGDTVSHREGSELGNAIAGTLRLYLAYGALLALGLLIQL